MTQSSQSDGRRCKKCGALLDSRGAGEVCVGCALENALEPQARTEAMAPVPDGVPEATAAPQSLLGRFGDYELLEEIARGGMGVVFKARQSSLDRLVAIKMLLFGSLARAEEVQRFRTEAAAAASLQHPNIVAIHEVGFRAGQHFIAMDCVAGRSLAEIVQPGPLPPRRAAGYVKTIAEAIQYAHERGVLHRDLKPSNVLIDPSDQPKVMDFGLAKRLEKDSELTLSGQVLGSPGYMAPEQAAGRRGQVGKRSDVYSLGGILYHLLTGRAPFMAATVAETLAQVQNAEPVSPTVLNPHLPRDLKTICLKCLEKEPSRRYRSAQELADELGRWLRGEPILARPIGPARKAWRWCRRKPLVASLTAAVAALFVAGFVGVLWQWNRSENNRALAQAAAYAAEMNLAHQALRMNNVGHARELLDRHRPKAGQEELRGWEWRYLWGRCQSDALFQLCRLPESDGVLAVALRSGASWVALGGWERGGVEVWDLTTRRRVAQLAPGERFAHVAFSPDGSRLAYSTIARLRVWDCATRVVVAETPLTNTVVALAFSPDGQTIVSFEWDTAVTRWRASNLEKLISRPLAKAHTGLIELGSPFAVTTDARTAAVVEGLNSIVVLDLDSGAERWRTNSPSGFARAVAISPDGARLATSFGIADGTTQLWDLATGVQLGRLEGHRAWVSALRFWPDGKSLVSASADQTIRTWDLDGARASAPFMATDWKSGAWHCRPTPPRWSVAARTARCWSGLRTRTRREAVRGLCQDGIGVGTFPRTGRRFIRWNERPGHRLTGVGAGSPRVTPYPKS